MAEFRIIPILGRKTAVPADDLSLFKMVGEGVALTHDTGGLNFDLVRKKNACSKSYGYSQWSNTANAQATKCLGLFELYDGTNRDYCFWDNGKFYVFDGGLDPGDKTAAAVTHGTNNADLVCAIRVGSYVVFTDAGKATTPYKWKNADANASKLIASGTEYMFKFIESFQRRVIGFFSDQTDGNIDLRYSTSWPGTAIISLNFPATNQIYIPNDDPGTGLKAMGKDRCFVYSENSIHALDYYADYTAPFRLRNIVDGQGAVNNAGIVNLGDRHYLYNKNYGFCEFRGSEFPHGGRPISEAIEPDLQAINVEYLNLIVGTFHSLRREVCWTVPSGGGSTPNALFFYNIDTGQWRKENKTMRFVHEWDAYTTFTWNDLIAALGGTGAVWSTAGSKPWAYYTAMRRRLVYANTNGHLYQHDSDGIAGANLDGYRIEPIMDFGDKKRHKFLTEIWFDIGYSGAFSIDVSYRGGHTAGEVIAAGWTSIGSVSCNSSSRPVLNCPSDVNTDNRLHQIKWGTNLIDEPFQVNGITFVFTPGMGTA